MNGLIQSQKWPVSFGPDGEIVVCDQRDEVWDGKVIDSPYPLDEDEDTSSAFLNAIEEDFLLGSKGCASKDQR
jgi:hypothetical protein